MAHHANVRHLIGCALLPLLAVACMPQAAAEAPAATPPYQPNFTYKVPAAPTKTDVTLGILNPQFSTDADLYQKQGDATVKKMLSSLGDSVGELLVAKGLKTTGPFPSLNDMTFPEKKAADLVLYPQINYSAELHYSNAHAAPAAAKPAGKLFELPLIGTKKEADQPAAGQAAPGPQVCDVKLTVSGSVSLVVAEPTTGAKMMNKLLKVDSADQSFTSQPCEIAGTKPQLTRELQEAWDKAHEAIFQSSMKAFDSYVNTEELQTFKTQAQELRDKKVYN